MLKTIFFDFDGVICQTEVERMDQLEKRLRSFGVQIDRRRLYQMVSGGMGQREKALDTILGDQAVYWKHRDEIMIRRPIQLCYPELLTHGLPQVLERLQQANIRMAVVSNSSEQAIHSALTECGIRSFFEKIFSGWEQPRCKPDPYLYLQALRCFGVQPAEALVVEDSPVGIAAGKAAGIAVAALRDRDGLLDQHTADFILPSIKRLLELPIVQEKLQEK